MIKKPIVLKPGALIDTQEVYDWYEEKLIGLGERFLAELEACYIRIENHPTSFGKFYKNYRKAQLKKYPYLVIYTITKTEILVFSVFHGYRNPGQRLKGNNK